MRRTWRFFPSINSRLSQHVGTVFRTRIAGWRGEIIALPPEALPQRFERLNWSQDWTVDTSRIRQELGYLEIVDDEEGLRRTIEWQQNHPNEKLAPTPEQYADDDRLLTARQHP